MLRIVNSVENLLTLINIAEKDEMVGVYGVLSVNGFKVQKLKKLKSLAKSKISVNLTKSENISANVTAIEFTTSKAKVTFI